VSEETNFCQEGTKLTEGIIQELTVDPEVNKFPPFMEPEGSLPYL